MLTTTRAKKKHVILLTDGQAPNGGIRDLVQAMAAEEITVSSVGLGAGVDENLLRMISDVGGGRFYKGGRPAVVAEDLHARDRDGQPVRRRRGVFSSRAVVSPADFLRGVDVAGAPYLHGYVATKPSSAPPAQEIPSRASSPSPSWRDGTWASGGPSPGRAT